MSHKHLSITVKNERDQQILFEQYKILFESVNKSNDTRENSNNFWIGANGVGVSILAFFRNTPAMSYQHKAIFLGTLCVVGILFCLTWVSYLITIKKSIEANSKILMEIEKNFPLSIFANVSLHSGEKAGKSRLTIKEMLVPLLFLGGYFSFCILLIFFPQEVL